MNKLQRIEQLEKEIKILKNSSSNELKDFLVEVFGFGEFQGRLIKNTHGRIWLTCGSDYFRHSDESKLPITRKEFELLLNHLKLEIKTLPAEPEKKIICKK